MASRFLKPETHRLDLSHGDWLLVKKRLTAGEQRRLFARMVKTMVQGEKIEMNPVQAGMSKIVEYLLDWSLTDPEGKPVLIRGKTPEQLATVLDGLDLDSFNEIYEVIEAHEKAMADEREQEKNASAGETASSATSASAP